MTKLYDEDGEAYYLGNSLFDTKAELEKIFHDCVLINVKYNNGIVKTLANTKYIFQNGRKIVI